MTKRMLLLWTLLAALCVVSALAADISGKWVAQIPGRQGNSTETTFAFKVEGGKLTGVVGSPRGEQQITEGKVSGEDVSFVTVFSGGDADIKISYKGKIAGNEIKFSRTFEGGGFGGGGGAPAPMEFVAKRAN